MVAEPAETSGLPKTVAPILKEKMVKHTQTLNE